MSSTSDAAAVAQVAYGISLMRYLSIMGMVLVIYDYLLTLDDEVRLMWPGPLYWPKVLFYINRYGSIIGMIACNYQILNLRPPLSLRLSVCQIYTWVSMVLYVVRFLAGTALLCLRVVALYHHVRWMKWLLWIGFALCYGLRSSMNFATTFFFSESLVYSSQWDLCLSFGTRIVNHKAFAIVPLVPTVAFEILLFALIIVKVFKNAKLLRSHPSSPIMRVVMRDEILWFFAIVTARMSLMVSWITFPPALISVAIGAEWGLESALISRLALNLRSACSHAHSTVGSRSVSSPVRAHPYWGREIHLTTGFSDGLETETSVYGSFPHGNEESVPEVATINLEPAMVSQTQRGGDEHDTKPIADLTPLELR